MISDKILNVERSRILVVGDVMLDKYWSGNTARISPEAPVPVVNVKDYECRPGGAANVAKNIAALGAQVTLMGLIGQDENGSALKNCLQADNIQLALTEQADSATITKLRVMSHDQQLIRLDFETDNLQFNHDAFVKHFQGLLAEHDLVVLSDYGKGLLKPVSLELIRLAKAANKPTLVDPKSANFAPYQGATVITPNWKEFTQVVGHCSDQAEITAKAKQQIAQNDLDCLLVTHGKHGLYIVTAHEDSVHLPTKAREVYDVTGAGDTVISVLAVALTAGFERTEAARIANLGAGIVVGKLGTSTVSIPELSQAAFSNLLKTRGAVSLQELHIIRTLLKASGKKLVMTNGCFDILHPGHLQYLKEAKARGDYLAIAVNSDDSVRQLKGSSRPINTLNDRMNMLAALACVDWVVPFDAQTPADVYEHIIPDVLVKGGDYVREEIVGYQVVTENGGTVEILSFVDGHSTTNIIQQIQNEVEYSE